MSHSGSVSVVDAVVAPTGAGGALATGRVAGTGGMQSARWQ